MEDEPKQCSLLEKSVLCRPEDELTLQPEGCKRNASLELPPSKSSHMLLAHKPGFRVLSIQNESFQSLPIHEASQALFWANNKNYIPLHKTVLRRHEKLGKDCNFVRYLFLWERDQRRALQQLSPYPFLMTSKSPLFCG